MPDNTSSVTAKFSIEELKKQITNLKQALQVSEKKYSALFEKMLDGFALHKIVLDKNDKPIDYIFLEVNQAFEKLTGLSSENLIGKKVTTALPDIRKDSADWIGKYGQVALTGKEIRFEQYLQVVDKWFFIIAFSPEKGYFITIFEDITDRVKARQQYEDKIKELEKMNQLMVSRELKMVELKKKLKRSK